MKKQFLIVFIITVLLVSSFMFSLPLVWAVENVVNGGFETGSLSPWNLPFGGSAPIVTSPVHSGTYAVQAQYSTYINQSWLPAVLGSTITIFRYYLYGSSSVLTKIDYNDSSSDSHTFSGPGSSWVMCDLTPYMNTLKYVRGIELDNVGGSPDTVDDVSCLGGAPPPDTTPPYYTTFSATADHAAYAIVTVSCQWYDDRGIYAVIFSHNNTGAWANYTDGFPNNVTSYLATYQFTLEGTVGDYVNITSYGEDTSYNWNVTSPPLSILVTARSPVTFQQIGASSQYPGYPTYFWAVCNSSIGLGSYIFSTNLSSSWVNQTVVSLGGGTNYTLRYPTSDPATVTLPSSFTQIDYLWYVKDIDGFWFSSDPVQGVINASGSCQLAHGNYALTDNLQQNSYEYWDMCYTFSLLMDNYTLGYTAYNLTSGSQRRQWTSLGLSPIKSGVSYGVYGFGTYVWIAYLNSTAYSIQVQTGTIDPLLNVITLRDASKIESGGAIELTDVLITGQAGFGGVWLFVSYAMANNLTAAYSVLSSSGFSKWTKQAISTGGGSYLFNFQMAPWSYGTDYGAIGLLLEPGSGPGPIWEYTWRESTGTWAQTHDFTDLIDMYKGGRWFYNPTNGSYAYFQTTNLHNILTVGNQVYFMFDAINPDTAKDSFILFNTTLGADQATAHVIDYEDNYYSCLPMLSFDSCLYCFWFIAPSYGENFVRAEVFNMTSSNPWAPLMDNWYVRNSSLIYTSFYLVATSAPCLVWLGSGSYTVMNQNIELEDPQSEIQISFSPSLDCGNWIFVDERFYDFYVNASVIGFENASDITYASISMTIPTYNGSVVSSWIWDAGVWDVSMNPNFDDRNLQPARTEDGVFSIASDNSTDYFDFRIWLTANVLDVYQIGLTANVTVATSDLSASIIYTNVTRVYSKGGFSLQYASSSPLAGHINGGDALELFAANGTYVTNDMVFHNLQHIKLLPELWGEFSLVYEFDYGIDYYDANGTRLNLLCVNLTASYIDVPGLLGGGDRWVNYSVNWYSRGVLIKTDVIYMFHHGQTWGLYADFTHRIWIDFWFNNRNGSTVVGGRVNAYEFPMQDNSQPYLRWLTTNWGPKDDVATDSMCMVDLTDADGNVIQVSQIKLMSVFAAINIGQGAPYYQEILLRKYEVTDLTFGTVPLQGIQTPAFDATLVPAMPNAGLFGFLGSMFTSMGKWLSDNIIYGGLSLWPLFVGFLDTIAAMLGAPHFFSNLFTWIASGFSDLIQVMSYVFGVMYDILLLLASLLVGFLSGIGQLITSILNMFNMLIGFMNGTIGGAGNLWNQLDLMAWFTVFLIFYPLWLLIYWEEKGTDALIAHLTLVFGILAWVFGFLREVAQFIINLAHTIIESIPVVE